MAGLIGLTFYFTKRFFDAGDRAMSWPEKACSKIAEVFQAKVNINNTSFTLQQKDIAELAVVQRRIICTTKYDASWLLSGATVIVQGTYTIKAGYDLKDGYMMNFDEQGRTIAVQLPDPKVLSITTEGQQVLFASEGLIKKIPPKEMETVFAQNLEQAKREANDLGLLEEAKSRIYERLNDVLGDDVIKIDFSSHAP
jgi:hypothetical protein